MPVEINSDPNSDSCIHSKQFSAIDQWLYNGMSPPHGLPLTIAPLASLSVQELFYIPQWPELQWALYPSVTKVMEIGHQLAVVSGSHHHTILLAVLCGVLYLGSHRPSRAQAPSSL